MDSTEIQKLARDALAPVNAFLQKAGRERIEAWPVVEPLDVDPLKAVLNEAGIDAIVQGAGVTFTGDDQGQNRARALVAKRVWGTRANVRLAEVRLPETVIAYRTAIDRARPVGAGLEDIDLWVGGGE